MNSYVQPKVWVKLRSNKKGSFKTIKDPFFSNNLIRF